MESNKNDANKTTKERIDKIKKDTLNKDKCKEMARRLTEYIKKNN